MTDAQPTRDGKPHTNGSDGHPRLVRDFIAVRDKVMPADRWDVKAG